LFTDFDAISSLRLAQFFLNLDGESVRSVDAKHSTII